MHIVLSKRKPGRIEFGMIYGTIAVLALIAARLLPLRELAPSCAFKAITGLPCPTCGATRSIVHLAHADIISALAMNPLFFFALLTAIFLLLYGLFILIFGLPRIKILLSEHEKDRVRILAVLVLLANWFYLLFAL